MRTGVGYDVIDVPAATELGVVVINVPDLWIREVANHALALLLAWNRKIVTLDREVHAGTWSSRVPGAVTGSLHGETVGIVGLGNIGSAFARRIAALETHVIACDPYVDDARFKALGVERVDLPTLAARADYVSVHALLNAETRGLINEAFFRRMKPTACLVNTSRGPVVDEAALVRALREGNLAGAALDVFEEEPLAADSPLRRMDNVILTPHAAYFSSPAVAQVPEALRRGDRARAAQGAPAQRGQPRGLRARARAPRPVGAAGSLPCTSASSATTWSTARGRTSWPAPRRTAGSSPSGWASTPTSRPPGRHPTRAASRCPSPTTTWPIRSSR